MDSFGIRVNEALHRYALSNRWRLMLAILAMMTFYISNRLIGLTLIIGVSSFTENSQSLARMLFESLVILVGLVTATGVLAPNTGVLLTHIARREGVMGSPPMMASENQPT